MLKNIITFLLAVGILFSGISGQPVRAETDNPVDLYLFWSKTCPHCKSERAFLTEIFPDHPWVILHEYEISSWDSVALLSQIQTEMGIDIGSVPLTIIGDDVLIGYSDAETTGKKILALLNEYRDRGDPDVVGSIIKTGKKPSEASDTLDQQPTDVRKNQTLLSIPFFGAIDAHTLSLPLLTIVIALLDGFNPCAMWTLLFLISLLIGMKDRTRMWILGGSFILASAAVYFLFLTAWLQVFLVVGVIPAIRMVIGIVAVMLGVYSIRKFWNETGGGCEVTHGERRQQIFARIRELTGNPSFFISFIGIILLAIAVNMVELVCSAGLPAVYTQILSLSQLTPPTYAGYMVLYILIFMLDDLVVFIMAMVTLRMVGIESKYARYSRLIGGIIIVVIGILLIFSPETLMFA